MSGRWNTLEDIHMYFCKDDSNLPSLVEFGKMWRTLSEDEKEYFRRVNLRTSKMDPEW